MRTIAENLWLLRYPLNLLGAQVGRTVTVMRLRSGELVVHSTAPFTSADVAAIRALGTPTWLVDVSLFHDTFAAAGQAAFPEAAYAAPEGFPVTGGNPQLLREPPLAWKGELEVAPIDGMPGAREYVFFHRPSRSLIVADLVFNFGADASAWTRWVFRWIGGIRQYPGVSRYFRSQIRDRAAFGRAIGRILRWDFDRLIVGHGGVIETGAKPILTAALSEHGFCTPPD